MRNLLMTSLVSLFMATFAIAETHVVDVGGSGDYTTIQPALDAAAEGDTVLVLPGTYAGAENRDLDFVGKNLVLRSNNFNQTSIIDCEFLGRAIFLNSAQTRSTIIEGLAFRNGLHAISGGAIYCFGASPSVRYCYFTENYAVQGGCIYALGSGEVGMLIENCHFDDNNGDYGAGIFAHGLLAPSITQCLFTHNVSDLKGGGIYCTTSSSGSITDCDFIQNNSLNGGAIALNIGSSPIIDGCFFDDNGANDGGAIGTFDTCEPEIVNCTFVHNSAADGSSLHFDSFSNATVHECILAFGTTGNVMGCGSSTPEIYHNLIWSNGGGNILCGNSHDNIYFNPEFCGTTNMGPYTLQSDSPAAAANNAYGILMGAFPVDCGESAALGSTWSQLKQRD